MPTINKGAGPSNGHTSVSAQVGFCIGGFWGPYSQEPHRARNPASGPYKGEGSGGSGGIDGQLLFLLTNGFETLTNEG
jgi:hypothetical protein